MIKNKIFPLGITTATLTPVMGLNPGRSALFHVLIKLMMGTIEGGADAPQDLIFCVDKSGSTSRLADEETGATILDVEKDALIRIVDSIQNPQTTIGVVSFDNSCAINVDVFPITPCDAAGKIAIKQFIQQLRHRDGTDYACGLDQVINLMPQADSSRKQAVIFTSDGENSHGNDQRAIALADRLRENGVTIYSAGIKVEDQFKPTMDAIANGLFRAANTAGEILEFFADAQGQTESAVVTNGVLRVKVPNFVESIEQCALALRGQDLDYVEGEVDPNNSRVVTVKFNDLGDEELSFYLALRVIQPENVLPNKAYSYGSVTVEGQIASLAHNGEIGKDNVVVYYAESDTIATMKERAGGAYMNGDVNNVIQAVIVARELRKASTTTDSAEAAKAVENARKTIAIMPQNRKFGLDKAVEIAAEKINENDLAGMTAAVRGATTAFAKPKNRAAAFNKKD